MRKEESFHETMSWVMECQHVDYKDVGGSISEQNIESRNKLLCHVQVFNNSSSHLLSI